MNENEVYSAPEADLDNGVKVNRIGGWLRCFQVINYIALIMSVVVIMGLFGVEIFVGGMFAHSYDVFAVLIELAPPVIFSYLIIRCLSIANIQTPSEIKKLLGYYLGFSLLIGFGLTMAHSSGHISDKPSPFIGDIIYYAIWVSYFRKSKRVNEYYGANAS